MSGCAETDIPFNTFFVDPRLGHKLAMSKRTQTRMQELEHQAKITNRTHTIMEGHKIY